MGMVLKFANNIMRLFIIGVSMVLATLLAIFGLHLQVTSSSAAPLLSGTSDFLSNVVSCPPHPTRDPTLLFNPALCPRLHLNAGQITLSFALGVVLTGAAIVLYYGDGPMAKAKPVSRV